MDRKRRKGLGREWLGICLLVGILGMSLLISHRMCCRHEEIARHLDTAVAFALAEDWEQAETAAHTARAQWEDGWNLSGILADLSPMEEIDTAFSQLAVWGKERKRTEFAAAGAALSRQIQTMADAHRLSWWNLL